MLKKYNWVFNFLEEAGNIAIQNQNSALANNKEDKSIVTNTDLEISSLFEKYVKNNTDTDHYVIDEETCETIEIFKEITTDKDYVWSLDPIDGTKAYYQGMDEWGIMVSLFYKNNPILATCYMPTKKTIIYADDKNSFILENAFTKEESKTPFKENKHDLNKDSIVMTPFSLHYKNDFNIVSGKYTLLTPYSAAHNFYLCYTGKAHAAFFSGNMKLWDMAISALFSKYSQIKLFNTKTGLEFNFLDLNLFENNWTLKTPCLLCKEKDFEEINKIITNK